VEGIALSVARRSRVVVVAGALALASLVAAVPSAVAFARDAAITAGDPARTQSTDGGGTSTCGVPGSPATISGGEHYDAYSYRNSSSAMACVSATVKVTTGSAWATAYLSSFDAGDALSNYVGGAGLSIPAGTTRTFSFNVPAGATFFVVVEEYVVIAATTAAPRANTHRDLSGEPAQTPFQASPAGRIHGVRSSGNQGRADGRLPLVYPTFP
jgi:hypothetical protein